MTEHEIKSTLIHHLISSNSTDLVALEIPFMFGRRRADVASGTNKSLTGYEIKSENDRVDRVFDQGEDYKQYFDKVIVVCEEKNFKAIRKVAPAWMGVWVCSLKGIVEYRKPKPLKRLNKLYLLSTVEKSWLKINFNIDSKMSQFDICRKLASSQTLARVREVSRLHFYEKYRIRYNMFINELSHKPNLDDLTVLRKQGASRLLLP